jgi:hypothetical protein
VTWDDVVHLAAGLPGVTVSTSYGTPALKLRGKLVTRFRPDIGSLVLLDVPTDERDMLIGSEPGIFHTSPHYDGYPAVLARLATIDAATLLGFLTRRIRNLSPRSKRDSPRAIG